jgi:hypothetical protein
MATKHVLEISLELKSELIKKFNQVSSKVKGKETQIRDSLNRIGKTGKEKFAELGKSFLDAGNKLGGLAGRFTGFIGKVNPAVIAVGALAAAFIGLNKAVQAANDVGIPFQQSIADLNAILRPTTEQLKAMEQTAKQLGETTSFSASEASQAFIELGKLGLTTNQILATTPAVLDAAAASGTDLAQTAEVVASGLAQFSLDASESSRVSDVMAKSFVTSALDLTKFSEATRS